MLLKGTCNRCGNCCVLGQYRCDHLKGEMGNTTCDVYWWRYSDMPITMTAPDGSTKQAYCLHKTLGEELVLRDLVREGKCSLEEVTWPHSQPRQPGA